MIEFEDLMRLMIELTESSAPLNIDTWMEENDLDPSGFEHFAEALMRSGIEITKLIIRGDEDTIEQLRNQGVLLEDFDPNSPSDIANLVQSSMIAVSRSAFTLGWEAHKQLGGAGG